MFWGQLIYYRYTTKSRSDHIFLNMNESDSAFECEENDQYSENDERDDDDLLVMIVVASRCNRRRPPQPMHNSRLAGTQRVAKILNGHEDIIQDLI